MVMPCNGVCPAGWQFTQRGCWMTLPASSNKAFARSALSAMPSKLAAVFSSAFWSCASEAVATNPAAASPAATTVAAIFVSGLISRNSRRHDRQAPRRRAGQPAPGIGDGRADRRHAGLADAGRLFRRGDDGDLDMRHLVDADGA